MQDFRIDQSLYDTGLFPPDELINTSCGINSSTSMSLHELKDTPATYKNSENRFLRINSEGTESSLQKYLSQMHLLMFNINIYY